MRPLIYSGINHFPLSCFLLFFLSFHCLVFCSYSTLSYHIPTHSGSTALAASNLVAMSSTGRLNRGASRFALPRWLAGWLESLAKHPVTLCWCFCSLYSHTSYGLAFSISPSLQSCSPPTSCGTFASVCALSKCVLQVYHRL